jgi:Putative auto-transporter adhesin, head GIN domain
MKKSILTLIAATVIVLGSVKLTYAATAANDTTMTLPSIGAFNKIEAHGNVEVIVSTGEKNSVLVHHNYYAENALIQTENGVLRITSYKAEKLMVYVTAKDLQTINAYDNAVVKSDGKIALISLDVNLFNTAYASLNLDNYAADITVNDQAKADLTGSVDEYSLNYSQSSTVNRAALVADNSTETLDMPFQSAPKHKHHAIVAINS